MIQALICMKEIQLCWYKWWIHLKSIPTPIYISNNGICLNGSLLCMGSSYFESFYLLLFLLFKKQFFIHSSSYQGGAGAIIGPLLFSHTRYHHHWRTGLLSSSAHFLLIDSLGSKITHTSIRCEMWQFSSTI